MSTLKRQWANIAVIGLALAAIIAVFATSDRVTTSEREARESNVLSAFREADISRVEVHSAKGNLLLERERGQDGGDDSWMLREPIKEEADPFAIQKLLGTLEFARFVRRIRSEEVDRAAFGLDAPIRRFKIQMGKIRFQLSIGKEAAQPKGAHYAEIIAEGAPGSGVLIIGRDLFQELDVGLEDLRGRLIVPYFSSEAERIVLEGLGGKRALRSLPHGRWRFDGMHGNTRVSRPLLDTLLVQFARLTADHFLNMKEAEAALGSEKIKISMFPKTKGDATGIVEVGGQCPKSKNDTVAIRRAPDPVAACVPKSVLEPLALPADRLLDSTVGGARKDEIESVTLRVGDKKLELNRKEAGFRLVKPVSGEVGLEAGNAFVSSLVDASGSLVPDADLASLGLAPPTGELSFKVVASDSAATEEKIELGRLGKDGTLHVRRKQDGAVLALSRDAARAFAPSAVLLRSPSVLKLKPAEIQSVAVSGTGTKQKFLRHPSGSFELVEPKGYSHDAALCVELVDLIVGLSAERWVADQDDGSFGFDKPAARLKIEVAHDAGPRSHEVLVGTLVSGGAYAKLLGEPGVFVVSRRVVRALSRWVIDRGNFMLNAANTSQISLKHDGKEIVLLRRGRSFVAKDPETAKLTDTAMRRLVEAMSSLRAEGAVHLGAAKPGEGLGKPVLHVKVEREVGGPQEFRIGAADTWRETAVHYARVKGVRATFAIAKSKVTDLLAPF